jgi:type I restriction-modification system DNA methylase subunit
VPPTTKGDTAFLQHMVEVCNDRAMVGVIMPHGVLFRGGAEADIREALLEEDLFESVIGLPEKLFYGTGIPAAVLILNKAKPQQRKGKVLFIDASPEGFYHEGKNRNSLRLEDILRIVAVFDVYAQVEKVPGCIDRLAKQWKAAAEMHRQRQLNRAPNDELQEQINAKFDAQAEEIEQARQAVHGWFNTEQPGGRISLEKFAAVVTLEEIAKENDYNLNISRYVDSSDPALQLDVKEELKKLRELEARRNAAEQRMDRLLEDLGYAV